MKDDSPVAKAENELHSEVIYSLKRLRTHMQLLFVFDCVVRLCLVRKQNGLPIGLYSGSKSRIGLVLAKRLGGLTGSRY